MNTQPPAGSIIHDHPAFDDHSREDVVGMLADAVYALFGEEQPARISNGPAIDAILRLFDVAATTDAQKEELIKFLDAYWEDKE